MLWLWREPTTDYCISHVQCSCISAETKALPFQINTLDPLLTIVFVLFGTNFFVCLANLLAHRIFLVTLFIAITVNISGVRMHYAPCIFIPRSDWFFALFLKMFSFFLFVICWVRARNLCLYRVEWLSGRKLIFHFILRFCLVRHHMLIAFGAMHAVIVVALAATTLEKDHLPFGRFFSPLP